MSSLQKFIDACKANGSSPTALRKVFPGRGQYGLRPRNEVRAAFKDDTLSVGRGRIAWDKRLGTFSYSEE